MKDNLADVCFNPVRQRILQVILNSKEATTSQILEILSDVPRASLYRHIKILLDAGIIEVVKETPRRGSIEKSYSIAAPTRAGESNEDTNRTIQTALFSLANDFSVYLSDEGNDPQKDMLTVGSATLMLSDREYLDFLSAYSQLIQKHLTNEPSEGRKARKITFISSPT